jgi:hypothetical protein
MTRSVMRLILASCLTLGGAITGGIFPGAILAFCWVANSGLSGSAAELLCFATNLGFGVGGAFCGKLYGRAIQPTASWWYNFLFPAVVGLMAGAVGYFWLDWALSHAETPL